MARFTNQAQLRYGNNVANSNIAVGEILEVLSATKTAVKNTYNQNDTITYVVSIVNSGNTAINGLTLSDNLGAYTFNTNTLVPLTYVNNTAKYYTNGTLQAAPAVTQGPPLSITGINVPAGGNATVIYEAALNEYAPLGIEAAVTNTATVSGTGRNHSGHSSRDSKCRGCTKSCNYKVCKSGAGNRKWHTDLYLQDSKLRKRCGNQYHRRGYNRHICSGFEQSYSRIKRHSLDCSYRLHLQ